MRQGRDELDAPAAGQFLTQTPRGEHQTNSWAHDGSKTSEPYLTQNASLPRSQGEPFPCFVWLFLRLTSFPAADIPDDEAPSIAPSAAPSTLLTTASAGGNSLFDALSCVDSSSELSHARPLTAPQGLHPPSTWCQTECYHGAEFGGWTALGHCNSFTVPLVEC